MKAECSQCRKSYNVNLKSEKQKKGYICYNCREFSRKRAFKGNPSIA